MDKKFISVLRSKVKWTFLIFIMILLTQCERDEPFDLSSFDCSLCYQDKPEYGPLEILVTINSENHAVPIVVYRGDIENNEIEYIDTAYYWDYVVDVPVDEYYSVTAEYKDGSNTIYSVDVDKLKLQFNTKDCDEDCYYYKGGYIDVRLRN
jgi:hypothetical protein